MNIDAIEGEAGKKRWLIRMSMDLFSEIGFDPAKHSIEAGVENAAGEEDGLDLVLRITEK